MSVAEHMAPFPTKGPLYSTCIPEMVLPFAMTDRDQAVKWVWRVRRWQVETALTIHYSSEGYEIDRIESFIQSAIVSTRFDPSSEDSIASGQQDSEIAVFGEEGSPATALTLNAGILGRVPAIGKVGETYYANGHLDGVISWEITPGEGFPFGILLTIDPTQPGVILTGSKMTVDGLELPIYSTEASSEFEVTLTGGITWTPYEYWEHDPGDDNGPIWDATTGEMLRPEYISERQYVVRAGEA